MNDESGVLFRIVLCVAFIASLYGGMTFLTAVMFAHGYFLLAIISGLILASMTAMALALFGLAWAMTNNEFDDDVADAPEPLDAGERVGQPG